MYAVAFDLIVAETRRKHPKASRKPTRTSRLFLSRFGFEGIQGRVYVCHDEDMAKLFQAITALKALPWFADCVRDIRAFRIEQWSDFTAIIKGQ